MDIMVRPAPTPGQRTDGEVLAPPSEDLRNDAQLEFAAMTAGLSTRLRFPSLESMRAGTVRTPHEHVVRLLSAGRRIGLPKAWALRMVAWLQAYVDATWPQEATKTTELRARAMDAESRGNRAELTTVSADARTERRAAIRAEREALILELVAEQQLLARLIREEEELVT